MAPMALGSWRRWWWTACHAPSRALETARSRHSSTRSGAGSASRSTSWTIPSTRSDREPMPPRSRMSRQLMARARSAGAWACTRTSSRPRCGRCSLPSAGGSNRARALFEHVTCRGEGAVDAGRVHVEVRDGAHRPLPHRADAHAVREQLLHGRWRVHRARQVEEHDVRLDLRRVELDPGQLDQSFRETARVRVVLRHALDVMAKRVDAAGRDDPRLTHGAAHLLLA